MLQLLCLGAYIYAMVATQPPRQTWIMAVSSSILFVLDTIRVFASPSPLPSLIVGAAGLGACAVAMLFCVELTISRLVSMILSIIAAIVVVDVLSTRVGVQGMEGFVAIMWGLVAVYHVRRLSRNG